MKKILASMILLALSSAACAATTDSTARTIEIRPPNGQPITITFASPTTENPYALTGNQTQPINALQSYQNMGHN